MKKVFSGIFFLSIAAICLSQQPAQYSLYMLNKYAFNPAYAGLDNSLSITGVYRNQWVQLDGNPVSQNVNAHLPFYIAGGGIGIGLENESLGSWKQTSLSLGYSYHLELNNKGILSLGASAGLVQRQLDGAKVRTPGTIFDDKGNPLDHSDPFIDTRVGRGSGLGLNAGLFYRGERFETAISTINLLGNKINDLDFSYEQERTYFFYAGYRFEAGRDWSFYPSFLVKSDLWQTQTDISFFGKYKENIFAGASFRGYHSESFDAIVIFGGFNLSERISVAYSLGVGISGLKNVHNGSHEILLNYNLGKPIGKGRPPAIIYNPRFL